MLKSCCLYLSPFSADYTKSSRNCCHPILRWLATRRPMFEANRELLGVGSWYHWWKSSLIIARHSDGSILIFLERSCMSQKPLSTSCWLLASEDWQHKIWSRSLCLDWQRGQCPCCHIFQCTNRSQRLWVWLSIIQLNSTSKHSYYLVVLGNH